MKFCKMSSIKKDKKLKTKTEKKLIKLVNDSDSDTESIHELSHYFNDRVKLMKEVIQILKPKKIKSMAPQCLKRLSTEELNSMLLEELLGISNKRLKNIICGEPQDDDSSSTDEEDQDIISLDDVTDDDFVIDLDPDDDDTTKKTKRKVKEEFKRTHKPKVKEEPGNKTNKKTVEEAGEQNLMSVLELLELQARARAIRSQLILESQKKTQQNAQQENNAQIDDVSDVEDAVIIESPKNDEIIITSSDSEEEATQSNRKEPVGDTAISTTENQRNVVPGDTNSSSHTISESLKRIDVATENLEDINKLFNKLHRMKKQKRKTDEQNTNHTGKKCRRKMEKLKGKKHVEIESETPNTSRENVTDEHQCAVRVENFVTSPVDGVKLDEVSEKDTTECRRGNEISGATATVENDVTDQDEHQERSKFKATKKQQEFIDRESLADKNVYEGDGIILNVDESEIESINLD